jgi:ribosomal protein L7/L12
MLCPSCNTSNDADATFCKHCGGALNSTAPAAGGGYSLVLNDPGQHKINVIKLVRELMSSNLLDAKTIVDMQSGTLHGGLSEEMANQIAEKFRAAGADVTVTRSTSGDGSVFQVKNQTVKVTFNKTFSTGPSTSSSSSPSAFNTPDAFNSPNPNQGQTSLGPVIAFLVMIGLAVAGYFLYMSAIHPK